MSEKIKKNVYVLSLILIAIGAIVLFRLVKIYDICCTVWKITSPVLFGYCLAWALNPIKKKIESRVSPLTSIILIVLFFIFLYGLFIWLLIPFITSNLATLSEIIASVTDKMKEYPIIGSIDEYVRVDANVLLNSCSNLFGFLSVFLLAHIFGFYMLYNYEAINGYIEATIPKKYKKMILEYTNKISSNMRLFLKATVTDTFVLFVISIVLYSLIGLKSAGLLAGFSAITNIIPFIGPYIGGIPAVLVGLSMSRNAGLLTLGAVVLAQAVESNIINPMIMSKCIKVNPLLIVISLTVMGKFLGLFGMVIAVPVIIILKITYEFAKKYKNQIVKISS